MNEKTFEREYLLNICKEFKEFLDENYRSFYKSMKIVGSLRRGLQQCHDIDILIMPEFLENEDLLGGSSKISLVNDIDFSEYAEVKERGEKMIKLSKKAGAYMVPIDVYVCINPDSYGVLTVIRTGSEEFNKKLMKPVTFGGLLPKNCVVDKGLLWKDGKIVPCETEEVFFEAMGIDYIQPKDRK